MSDNRAVTDAREFFRRVADDGWGRLAGRGFEREDETITEARHVYWEGIKRAWSIYTKDNEAVKQANEVLRKVIHQAYERYADEDKVSDVDYVRYVKELFQAHDDYAETVAQVWKAFAKDMKKKKR